MSIFGKISFGVFMMQRTPLIRINIARTMKVSGLLRARLTIHIVDDFYEAILFSAYAIPYGGMANIIESHS
jgi:hypothetical protein